MSTPVRAGSKQYRREVILAASIELFRQRGFHGVGIDEIGAAAGITGPGVYRHFDSKQDVLAAVIARATDALLSGGTEIVAQASGRTALERLADFHASFVVGNRSLGIVYYQESKNLDSQIGKRLRARQRLYLDCWTAPLAELRPAMPADERLLAVHSAVGLLNSAAYFDGRVDDVRLQALLVQMALCALLEDVSTSAADQGRAARRS